MGGGHAARQGLGVQALHGLGAVQDGLEGLVGVVDACSRGRGAGRVARGRQGGEWGARAGRGPRGRVMSGDRAGRGTCKAQAAAASIL